MALPGRAICVRQGPPCPDGNWHDEEAIRARAPGFDGRVWYLAPDGDDESSGGRDAPLRTVSEAHGRAVSGDILALGVGRFDEAIRIRRRLAIVGACVEQTTVTASPSDDDPVIEATGNKDIAVSDLTVTGARGGIWLRESGRAQLRGVSVRETVRAGVAVAGDDARMVLEDVVIADTQGRSGDLNLGYGLDVESGAEAEVVRGFLSGNHDVGVVAIGRGTIVRMEDVVVARTQPDQGNASSGRGVGVNLGATVEVSRVVVHRSHEFGVFVRDAGSRLTGDFLVIEMTQPRRSDGSLGHGLSVQAGGHAVLSHVVLDRNHDVALLGMDADTEVTVGASLIAATQATPHDGTGGLGVVAQGAARVNLTQAVVDSNHSAGVIATFGAQLTLEDIAIVRTQPQPGDGSLGRGIHLTNGATVTVVRGLVDLNHDVGVLATGLGSGLQLTDVAITRTQAQRSDLTAGRGLDLSSGAEANVTRAKLDGNHSVAIAAFERGTSLTFEDLTVTNTQPRPADRSVGRGVSIHEGADVTVTRGFFGANHEVAIVAFDPGTTATLRHVTVRDTAPTPCSPVEIVPTCDGFLGSGIAVLEAKVILEDFQIMGSALAGIQILEVDEFHATRGVVSENLIGLNVQDADLDIAASFEDVWTFNNGVDRDFAKIHVPSAADALSQLKASQ